MLSEAGVIHQIHTRVDDMMGDEKEHGRSVTRCAVQAKIEHELSRLASPAWALYLTYGPLKLFDTKGVEYNNCVDRKVVVTYEEQGIDGYYRQVDYLGHVKAVDPFDGLCVQFGEDGDWWVDCEDEWDWLDDDLQWLMDLLEM